VRQGAPFLIAAVAIHMIFNADVLLLEWLRGDAELGMYAASYALAAQILLLAGPSWRQRFPVFPPRAGLRRVPGWCGSS
jgi:hypothetical protein